MVIRGETAEQTWQGQRCGKQGDATHRAAMRQERL
jgi:hypothetical protein